MKRRLFQKEPGDGFAGIPHNRFFVPLFPRERPRFEDAFVVTGGMKRVASGYLYKERVAAGRGCGTAVLTFTVTW
jgi:hypothetical protein